MGTAKHRAINVLKRGKMLGAQARGARPRARRAARGGGPEYDAAIDDQLGDERLSLLFTSCHPVLAIEARVALTLRVLGGLTTAEVARAFLVSEPTIAQQKGIVGAKQALPEARVPFEVPRGGDRAAGFPRCSRWST